MIRSGESYVIGANLNLDGADHELFEAVYASTSGSVPIPDIAIFLDLQLDHILQRIRDRGRDYEHDVAPAYLKALRHAYDHRNEQLGVRVNRLEVNPTMTPAVAASVVRLIRGERGPAAWTPGPTTQSASTYRIVRVPSGRFAHEPATLMGSGPSTTPIQGARVRLGRRD